MSALGAVLGAAVNAAAQPPPAAAGPAPICRPAPDPEYGRSPARAIQVGGGPLYGSARQRRFLDALTGPKGEPVRYVRNVATTEAPDGTLVDAYEVTYDGLAQPVSLVLDWYHYTEQFAPAGFLCGRDPKLGTPPPDPFLGGEQLRALALAIAAAPGFRAGPIDLGDPPEAVIADQFRVLSRRARAGSPAPSREAAEKTPGTTVVAFPRTCAGQPAPAVSIVLVNGRGESAEPLALLRDAKAVQQLMPGHALPPGSVGATFAGDALQARLDVRATFPGSCGATADRAWPIAYEGAQLVDSPMPARPAGDTSDVEWVAVQAVIDHQGQFQQAQALGGPPALEQAAVEAVKSWKALPPRANGAPVAAAVVLRVSFTAARP